MLFTRCPNCQTNFRVTADALRVADGQVRCGRCDNVFNAFAELQADVEAAERPSTAAASVAPGVDHPQDDLSPVAEARPALDGPDGPDSSALADRPTEVQAQAQPPTELVGDGHEDANAGLEFDLPKDAWTKFFEQVEEDSSGTTAPPATDVDLDEEQALMVTSGRFAGEPQRGDDTEESSDELIEELPVEAIIEEIEIGWDVEGGRQLQPAATDSLAPPINEFDTPAKAPRPHARDEIESPTDSYEALAAPAPPEEVDAAPLVDTEVDTEVDAEVAPATGPPLFSFGRLLPASGRSLVGYGRWGVGSALLLTALALQAAHHFRVALASQPLIGPLLQAAYSQVGAELTPSWDLSQYEIMDWVATAEPSASGQGSLRISAQIHNRGPKAQPYPSLHLELKDRWDEPVGSRVLQPNEYLQAEASADGLMAANTTVPARIEVVDPGQDAYGFELDVCVEIGGGRLSCASDRVFQ